MGMLLAAAAVCREGCSPWQLSQHPLQQQQYRLVSRCHTMQPLQLLCVPYRSELLQLLGPEQAARQQLQV